MLVLDIKGACVLFQSLSPQFFLGLIARNGRAEQFSQRPDPWRQRFYRLIIFLCPLEDREHRRKGDGQEVDRTS